MSTESQYRRRLASNYHTFGPRRPNRRAGPTWLVAILVLLFLAVTESGRIGAAFSSLSKSPEQIASIEASVYYAGCNDARAASAAPIYAGQPGYREEMDGDGDGIACEPFRP